MLGARIVNGTYPSGSVLLASELEEELGVSRSVIREAVRVLTSAGLLHSVKHVGSRVLPSEQWNPYDPLVIRWRLTGPGKNSQLRSLTELRVAIEPVAAELAALYAPHGFGSGLRVLAASMGVAADSGDLRAFLELDVEFHSKVLVGSGNEMFASLAGPIGSTLRGRAALGLLPEHPHGELTQLHMDIADAIATHDPVRARSSMELVVRRTMAGTSSVWAEQPRVFPGPASKG
ncbi:FCD domain-containing protein [Paeniglutamicibacter cryotolerans]